MNDIEKALRELVQLEDAEDEYPLGPWVALQTCQQARKEDQEYIGRLEHEIERLKAQPVALTDEPRFLLVAMDDDGCGNPFYCTDERDVRAKLAPLLFFFNEKHPLSAEHEEQIDAQCAALIEDGFLNFEGDPGITLYKLHRAAASPQPATTKGEGA